MDLKRAGWKVGKLVELRAELMVGTMAVLLVAMMAAKMVL